MGDRKFVIFPNKMNVFSFSNSEFVSTSNLDSLRNLLSIGTGLMSCREFLCEIKRHYGFALFIFFLLDALDVELGFYRVDIPPKGSKTECIVVILARAFFTPPPLARRNILGGADTGFKKQCPQ